MSCYIAYFTHSLAGHERIGNVPRPSAGQGRLLTWLLNFAGEFSCPCAAHRGCGPITGCFVPIVYRAFSRRWCHSSGVINLMGCCLTEIRTYGHRLHGDRGGAGSTVEPTAPSSVNCAPSTVGLVDDNDSAQVCMCVLRLRGRWGVPAGGGCTVMCGGNRFFF